MSLYGVMCELCNIGTELLDSYTNYRYFFVHDIDIDI
jgi:hypothetical protein